MQELEKILKEIDEIKVGFDTECRSECDLYDWSCGACVGECDEYIKERAKDIIRKHMNDGWIPVEERLPEEAGTYIINALTGERNIVTFAKWQNRYKRFDMTGARTYWKIIAWRPLPETQQPADKTVKPDWRDSMLQKFDRRSRQ